jgi:hypothetical protein
MKKKYTLILDDEFIQYCQLNKIDNIDEFAKKTFNKGFTSLKYGDTPPFIKPTIEPTKVVVEKTPEVNPERKKIEEIKKDLKKVQMQNKPETVKNKSSEILYDE